MEGAAATTSNQPPAQAASRAVPASSEAPNAVASAAPPATQVEAVVL